jgi:hypothetical protein
MQAVLQTLNNTQPNQQAHQQQAPPPPHQSRLVEFLRTCPTTFSQAMDPMEAQDWLKGLEKKLVIGMTANWWETYCNTHVDVDSITWNEFKSHFRNHYVPRGTMKLNNQSTDLKQGSMMVNEYLN